MKTICKFCVYSCDWTRDHWSSKTCYEDVSNIFEEAKSYIGLSANFDFQDWFGSVQQCNVKITNVELVDDKIIITEEANIDMQEHYMPCPWQIIKPNFITEPDDFDDLSKEETKAFYAQFTFLSPKSCSRL